MFCFNFPSFSYASSFGPYSSQFWKDAANGAYNKSMKAKHEDFKYLVSPMNSIFDISLGDDLDNVINAYQGSPYNERWVASTLRTNAGSIGNIKLNSELDPIEGNYYYNEDIVVYGLKNDNQIYMIIVTEKYRISLNSYSSYDKRAQLLIDAATKSYGAPVKKSQTKTTWEKDGMFLSIWASHSKDNGYCSIVILRGKV